VKTEKRDRKSDEERSEGEDGEKASKYEELNTKAKEHFETMMNEEMKLLHKVYSETFIRRVLRLVEIFTSVAQMSAHLMSMVFKVASPYMLFLLLNLTLIASPRTKMLSLKIITNLINIGIPAQIFEETIKMWKSQPNSLRY
jgi:quinol monooxygenase YgiN